jgi:phosphoglycolate phosphatase
MTARGVLFDLDGTLVDTLGDIAASMNHVLGALGLPEHAPTDYRAFIGEGVARLAERAVPAARVELAPAVTAAFRAHYAEHLLDRSQPYPGIRAALAALVERGAALAVLSNKPDALTRRIVAALFPDVRFGSVAGSRPDVPPKPDPAAALAAAAALGLEPGACVLVGDSGVDMRTAVAAGMPGIGVLWGFRESAELLAAGARAVIGHPDELAAALSR